MFIAVDWDSTVVEPGPYDTSPMRLVPGAREALYALKAANHRLLLWSGRASRSLLFNPRLDPFVQAGTKRMNEQLWEEQRGVHLERYRQMVEFVERELPGVFDAIDNAKPTIDLILDDKATGRFTRERWGEVARRYGAQPDALAAQSRR